MKDTAPLFSYNDYWRETLVLIPTLLQVAVYPQPYSSDVQQEMKQPYLY